MGKTMIIMCRITESETSSDAFRRSQRDIIGKRNRTLFEARIGGIVIAICLFGIGGCLPFIRYPSDPREAAGGLDGVVVHGDGDIDAIRADIGCLSVSDPVGRKSLHFREGGYSILRRRKDGSSVLIHKLFIAQPNGVAGVLRDVDSEMLIFVVGGELDSGIKRVAVGIFYFQRLAAP